MADNQGTANALGPNECLVDEMYEHYRADPKSVSPSWQEFFEDYRRDQHEPVPTASKPATAAVKEAPAAPPPPRAPPAAPKPAASADGHEPEGQILRGVAARIAINMAESLKVPTATSFRE